MANGTMIGKNLEMFIEGNTLTMRIDLTKDFGLSPSGKTYCVASSGGNAKLFNIPGGENFANIVASVNIMKYAEKKSTSA